MAKSPKGASQRSQIAMGKHLMRGFLETSLDQLKHSYAHCCLNLLDLYISCIRSISFRFTDPLDSVSCEPS